MTKKPTNPHDAYAREILSHPADAASEIRVNIDAELAARIDFDAMGADRSSRASSEGRCDDRQRHGWKHAERYAGKPVERPVDAWQAVSRCWANC
ncbi:hypothetical protein [Nocardia sp. NPDC058666]|uniref:hypothetical protein n=1 Tax=Nocardia sp. NPDC058666 TaxID=3346587 RepID=UPI003654488F